MLYNLHCHLLKYISSSFHFVTLLTMSKNLGIYKLSIIYMDFLLHISLPLHQGCIISYF